jgi:hypothetical protein
MDRKTDEKSSGRKARRKFLKEAAVGAAVTPPAVTMLLSAGSRRAMAGEASQPSGIVTISTVFS